MVTSGDSWFVVLPDHEGAATTAANIDPQLDQWVRHPSGRPWLRARAGHQDVIVADAPAGKLAVIGYCPVTAGELAGHAARVFALSDLDQLATRLPGSFHLLATCDGEVRVQGTVSGLRRVCRARLGDVAIASDRADVLAELTGAGLATDLLALWLLFPGMPAPLADLSPWRGVRKARADAYVHLDRSGRARERTWWRPPEPDTPLADGAATLAELLSDSVAAFGRVGSGLSADLSGGLDSTSLCFLASRAGARISAVTYAGRDPGNDDAQWARQAADELASAGEFRHLVLQPDETPLPYQGFWEPGEPMDEPFTGMRDMARIAFGIERAAGDDTVDHLSGFGADEVLQAPVSAVHTIVRQHPRIGMSYLRGYRAQHRWRWGSVLPAIADDRSYADWLADSASNIVPFGDAGTDPVALGWDGPFRVPPWVRTDATDSIRRLLRESAAGAEALAPTRGQHGTVAVTRRDAATYRLAQRFVERTGRRLVMPFLDDRIFRTCLSVRLHERTTPWQYKPLLVEAMRGVVPEHALSRSTKGHIGSDLHVGLRRSRQRLAELLDDPIVGRLGLVDVAALRSAFLAIYPPKVPIALAEATLACEVWLRAVTDKSPQPVKGSR
jgi:asparagine synthase (glutamine-hydrolysing)